MAESVYSCFQHTLRRTLDHYYSEWLHFLFIFPTMGVKTEAWKRTKRRQPTEVSIVISRKHHFRLVCYIGCNSTTAWKLGATDWSLGLPNWDLGSFKKNYFPSKSHQPTATTGALFACSKWQTSERLMCLHSLNTLRADWDWETGGQWDTTESNYTQLKTIRIITKEELKLQKARNKNQPSKEKIKERQVHNSPQMKYGH